jgi:hypothetical protein
MAPWRVAQSLLVLRKQIDALAPSRSKASDGTIGDAEHSLRDSDHNPWVKDGRFGVVTALDITNDPANGVNSEDLAEALRLSKDPRIKYIISNRKISNPLIQDGAWRPYSGANPHTRHVHISVRMEKALYDDQSLWNLEFFTHPRSPAPWPSPTPSDEFDRDASEPKPLSRSKIAIGSGSVAGVEAVDAANMAIETLEAAARAKDAAERIGLWEQVQLIVSNPRFLAAVAVVVIALAIIYWRWRDHGRGQKETAK